MLGIVTTPLLYAYSGLKTLGNCVLDIPQAVKQAFNTLANCFTSQYARSEENTFEATSMKNNPLISSKLPTNLQSEEIDEEEIDEVDLNQNKVQVSQYWYYVKENNTITFHPNFQEFYSFIKRNKPTNFPHLMIFEMKKWSNEEANLIEKQIKLLNKTIDELNITRSRKLNIIFSFKGLENYKNDEIYDSLKNHFGYYQDCQKNFIEISHDFEVTGLE